jgi:hypothetical protein
MAADSTQWHLGWFTSPVSLNNGNVYSKDQPEFTGVRKESFQLVWNILDWNNIFMGQYYQWCINGCI